jgi:hypothetical protein
VIAIWSLVIAVILLLLLLLIGVKGTLSARELEQASSVSLEGSELIEPCPPELADLIFARDDWVFVSKMRSPNLNALFQKERKAVGLLWVQQTALRVRQVMREHARVARSSRDLEFATEVRLLAQYAELMLVCATLFVLIQVAGPVWLGRLAAYAQSLSTRIAEAQRAFQMTVDAPESSTVR